MNRRLSDQFQLRLPDGMRERLKDMANRNGHSLNREIVSRIENSFSQDLSIAHPQHMLDKLGSLPEHERLRYFIELEKLAIELHKNMFGSLSAYIESIDEVFEGLARESSASGEAKAAAMAKYQKFASDFMKELGVDRDSVRASETYD